jgi:hypothetical protein
MLPAMQLTLHCCCACCCVLLLVVSQPHNRAWDRWLMMGSIGVTTGLVGYCLYLVSTARGWVGRASADSCHSNSQHGCLHPNLLAMCVGFNTFLVPLQCS